MRSVVRRSGTGQRPSGVLGEIDHFVVVMLENRSFDHMLGYLSLPEAAGGRGRADIDGVQAHENVEVDEEEHRPQRLGRGALTKAEDPAHDGWAVDQQVRGGAEGYVHNYARTHPNVADKGLVLDYYTREDLPVYDFLAEHFCVCDHWFSSVPGATWPNRLYALAGGSGGKRENAMPPLYSCRSFVRHLEERGVSWCWYAHDPATLRLVDDRYRFGPDDGFAPFERPSMLEPRTFFRDVASGELPKLAWIDPNFVDLGGPGGANDDHPPSDVRAAQELVLKVYIALASSDLWGKTLLLVTYDEHGGFYDHVTPPAAEDDHPSCRRYGPRVPALVASPWVTPRSVCNRTLDHTSIIKTALRLFCSTEADALANGMGRRVATASDLSVALDATEPRPAVHPPPEVAEPIVRWRAESHRRALENPLAASASTDTVDVVGALGRVLHTLRRSVGPPVWRLFGRRRLIGFRTPTTPVRGQTELTQEVFAAARELRRRGLPPGRV